MNYGEVLGKAWKIIWKHKVLWLFGFLASCAEGGGSSGYSGGGGGGGSSSHSNYGNPSDFFQGGPGFLSDMERFFNDIGHTMYNMEAGTWVLIGLAALLVILLLSFIQLALATFGRTGMVKGTWQADEGAEGMKFMEILQSGMPYFWRVFLLHFLTGIVVFFLVIMLVLLMVLFSVITLGIGLLLMIPLAIILFIPVAMFVDVMLELATTAIVAEDLGIIDSMKRAWGIVVERPLQLLLMELILGIGSMIAGFLIVLPFLLAVLPFVIGALSSGAPGDWSVGARTGGIISLAFFCLFLPVYIVLSSMLTAYVKSAWTLTYRRLTGVTVLAQS